MTTLLLVISMKCVKLNADLLVPKFGNYEYLWNRKHRNVPHLPSRYSKAILNQPQGEKKVIVSTGISFEIVWKQFVET